jgi:hypothetical protein
MEVARWDGLQFPAGLGPDLANVNIAGSTG